MARYTGPKRRLSRREGIALFAKDVKFLERKGAVTPGQHGLKRKRKPSDYGIQLREKQKTKRLYGLMEKQFQKYYVMASKIKGSTGLKMLEFLETRLDNTIYRLGFAQSRAQARQLVSHGHIVVDGKKVDIPSYQVKIGQTLAISPKLVDNTQVKSSLEHSDNLPGWLERKATVGRIVRLPERDEMEKAVDETMIVEYYSR